MSALPVRAVRVPFAALLSGTMSSLLAPAAACGAPLRALRPAGGYAAFDEPTYLRRGLRIAGLDAAADEAAADPCGAGVDTLV